MHISFIYIMHFMFILSFKINNKYKNLLKTYLKLKELSK